MDDVTRSYVRVFATAYVVATLASTAAVLLGAESLLVVAVAAITFGVTWKAAEVVARLRGEARAHGQPRWWLAFVLGALIGNGLAGAWFPRHADAPAETAGWMILTIGLGLATWLAALMLPLARTPLARFADWPGEPAPAEPESGAWGDLALFGAALASILVRPMSWTAGLPAPYGWPLAQLAMAGLVLLLPLIKRRSLDAALVVYRLTFLVFALGTAPALGPGLPLTRPQLVVFGVTVAAVLVLCVLGHVRTAHLRAALESGPVPDPRRPPVPVPAIILGPLLVAMAAVGWYVLWPVVAPPAVTCAVWPDDPRRPPFFHRDPCADTRFANWYTVRGVPPALEVCEGLDGRPRALEIRPADPALADMVGESWRTGWLVTVERYFGDPVTAFCVYSSDTMVDCELLPSDLSTEP